MSIWTDGPEAPSEAAGSSRIELVPAFCIPAEEYLQFLMRNRVHIAAYMPDEVLALTTASEIETFQHSLELAWCEGQALCFVALNRASRELTAQVYVQQLDAAAGIVEIGYFTDLNADRRGYASEAVEDVARFLFSCTSVHKICLVCDERHARSRGVAERTGFVLEGVLREHALNKDGSRPNRCFYGRLRSDIPRPARQKEQG